MKSIDLTTYDNKLLKIVSFACLLFGSTSFAQENDSIKVNDLEGVIINATLKKDSEYVNKMPLKSLENPQLFSTVDKIFFEK